ncbi:hypothetical protein ABTC77_19800, partial [Acinetobacter baumannii]
ADKAEQSENTKAETEQSISAFYFRQRSGKRVLRESTGATIKSCFGRIDYFVKSYGILKVSLIGEAVKRSHLFSLLIG